MITKTLLALNSEKRRYESPDPAMSLYVPARAWLVGLSTLASRLMDHGNLHGCAVWTQAFSSSCLSLQVCHFALLIPLHVMKLFKIIDCTVMSPSVSMVLPSPNFRDQFRRRVLLTVIASGRFSQLLSFAVIDLLFSDTNIYIAAQPCQMPSTKPIGEDHCSRPC